MGEAPGANEVSADVDAAKASVQHAERAADQAVAATATKVEAAAAAAEVAAASVAAEAEVSEGMSAEAEDAEAKADVGAAGKFVSPAKSAAMGDAVIMDDEALEDLFGDSETVAPSGALSVASPAKPAAHAPIHSSASATTGDADLPHIDAPEDMAPTAVRAARVALKAGDRPDLCKLCVTEPKAGKAAWCKGCRRKVEAAEFQARQRDLACRDGTPNMDQLDALKSAANLTQLRLTIFDFEAKTNPSGEDGGRSGAKRPSYDFL